MILEGDIGNIMEKKIFSDDIGRRDISRKKEIFLDDIGRRGKREGGYTERRIYGKEGG